MNTATPFTAIVLAGDRRVPDPVAQAAGVACKALVPVAGAAMVLRVLAALNASAAVGRCVLCGPAWSVVEQTAVLHTGITTDRFDWAPPQASPSASAGSVLERLPAATPVLLTTADHALLSADIVDYFCAEARISGCDAAVAVALHSSVTAAYPTARRTAIKLRDGGYCGCNLFAFLTPRGRALAEHWRRVEQQRKQPWQVIRILGFMALLRYLLGRLTLAEALARLSARLQLNIGAVILPFAEAAVDVDTVADWHLVQTLAR